jgi:hypothetical protein
VKYPPGIVAFWIRVEDPGKREAQLSESPRSTDGLKIGGGNGGTRASQSGCAGRTAGDSGCATEQDSSASEGDTTSSLGQAV